MKSLKRKVYNEVIANIGNGNQILSKKKIFKKIRLYIFLKNREGSTDFEELSFNITPTL